MFLQCELFSAAYLTAYVNYSYKFLLLIFLGERQFTVPLDEIKSFLGKEICLWKSRYMTRTKSRWPVRRQ